MTKREELDAFILRADELISSKYILADVKIVNLLKSIAASDTIVALFKNCLTDFDYYKATKEYLVKSSMADGKGEFITPPSSKELLAFIFNILMDIDSGKIKLAEFIDVYFYEDGSMYSGYQAFLKSMIVPFKNSVKLLMESVIDGKLQDPVEALTEEEVKRAKQVELEKETEKKEKELAKKAYGGAIKQIKATLLEDKQKIKAKKMGDKEKDALTLVVDMLGSVIESTDKDAIEYAFVAYKFAAKTHRILFFGRISKMEKLVEGVINEL
ncbi:MAG: hypothetical protein SPL13_00665 [Clostridia bacterium]|nr:hypothetical protein [Clostridia bacterium]